MSDYGKDAYTACLYGRADERQQRAVASSVALLYGWKGGLAEALETIADIAEASTTANSLPNIAKIARAALEREAP